MEIFQTITTKAGIVPKLRLLTKEEGKAPVSTGPHKVRILEAAKGAVEIENKTTHKMELHIWVYFEENGQKVRYAIPIKNKEGGVHYLVERFAEYKEGDEIIMEGVNKGGRSYISTRKAEGELPTIQESDEVSEEESIPVIKEDDGNLPEDFN